MELTVAKKVVSKGKLSPMERVDRFRARKSKVAEAAEKLRAKPARPKHVVNQISVSFRSTAKADTAAEVGKKLGGQTPQTVATWIEQMETKICKALRRGEFHRAVALVGEVERRGLDYDPANDVQVGLDEFLSAHFDSQLASVFARNGVLMFRQLLNYRPDQLLELDGVGPLWADKVVAFCRAHFSRADGRLATRPGDGYRPSGTLAPGEKQRVNRGFVE